MSTSLAAKDAVKSATLSHRHEKSAAVSPEADQALRVDKNIVDELLLVCGVIGTTVESDETGHEHLVPVTDCLNWLQDLQRALRRDDDQYRTISLLLGQWKVVQQKLLPLVISCRYDTSIVITVCKILVMLTKPIAAKTKRAGRMVIDTKKYSPQVVQQQGKIRENALQQAEQLVEYKRAICHHPSHFHNQQGGLLSIFVALLAEPISKTGSSRTDNDHLTIELVLHLLRNLLAAEPLLNNNTTAQTQQLHHEFVVLLERELVLEIFTVLAADIEQRENVQYNLLLMELLNSLLRHQDPTAVALSSQNTRKTTGQLKQQLARDKHSYAIKTSARHSHFGGTLVRQQGDKKTYVSTAALVDQKNTLLQHKRRKNKLLEPFAGTTLPLRAHSRIIDATSPAQERAQNTIDAFCRRFVTECYGPVMKSLKNEFRRDSVRLEDDDRVTFFRLAWFFSQWWRMSPLKNNTDTKASSSIGQLIFTMDIFTFNLVLNATDTFLQHKRYSQLAQAVAFLGEMMQLLYILYTSEDSTEHVMAMGLMDRLFYGSEPLDRLPKLLSSWQPGTSTREYVCDLVEVCHWQLKLLDASAKDCAANLEQKDTKHDTVARMRSAVADFNLSSYFGRRIVTNHTIFMYTHLLSQYAAISITVNQRVVDFFRRVSKHTVVTNEANDDADMPQNPLALKTATLEPLLYTFHLFTVYDSILNDVSMRGDPQYTFLEDFCCEIMKNFVSASKTNPVLFIEALLKHPYPHRYCESVSNLYVTEELRMIAERKLLLEEHRKLEEEVEKVRNQELSDDDEDELEFEDFNITTGPIKSSKERNTRPKRKLMVDSDDEISDAKRPKPKEGSSNDEEEEATVDEESSKRPKRMEGGIDDGATSDEEEEATFDEESSKRPKRKEGGIDVGESSDEEEEATFNESPSFRSKVKDDSDTVEHEQGTSPSLQSPLAASTENTLEKSSFTNTKGNNDVDDEESDNDITFPATNIKAASIRASDHGMDRNDADSSDDEDIFNKSLPTQAPSSRRRLAIDDDSDDELM